MGRTERSRALAAGAAAPPRDPARRRPARRVLRRFGGEPRQQPPDRAGSGRRRVPSRRGGVRRRRHPAGAVPVSTSRASSRPSGTSRSATARRRRSRSSRNGSTRIRSSRRTAIASRTSSARRRSSASTGTSRRRSRRARRPASPATTTGSSSVRSSGSRRSPGSREPRGSSASPTAIRRRGFLDYQCRHGLGHGLMIQTGYDLPLALSICGASGRAGITRRARAVRSWRTSTRGSASARHGSTTKIRSIRARGRASRTSAPATSERAGGSSRSTTGSFERTATACARPWEVGPNVLPRVRARCRREGPVRRAEIRRALPRRRKRARQTVCRRRAYGRERLRPRWNRAGGELCAESPRAHACRCFSGVGLVLGMLHPTPCEPSCCVRASSLGIRRPPVRAQPSAEVDPGRPRTPGGRPTRTGSTLLGDSLE